MTLYDQSDQWLKSGIVYISHFVDFKRQAHGKIYSPNSLKKFSVFWVNGHGKMVPVSNMHFLARNITELQCSVLLDVYTVIEEIKKKEDPSISS